MINPALEKKLADCSEMRDQWRKFRDLFNGAVNNEAITPEREMEFLKVKSAIAMLFDAYLEAIRTGPKIAQNVMTIVSRSITLKHVANLSLAESKKFEIEWHESFLQMEETVTQLEEDRKRLAGISASSHMRRQMIANAKSSISRGLRSNAFKMIIILSVVFSLIGAGVYFQVPEKMYANPSTRPWAVLIFRAYRMVTPDMPFRSLKDEKVIPETLPRNKPGGWGDIKPLGEEEMPLDKAAGEAVFTSGNARFDGSAALKGAAEMKPYEIAVSFDQRKFSLSLTVFRMNTNDEAIQIMNDYQRFLDQRTTEDKLNGQDPNKGTSFFRKNNLIVYIKCQERGPRQWVRQEFFQVKFPDDKE